MDPLQGSTGGTYCTDKTMRPTAMYQTRDLENPKPSVGLRMAILLVFGPATILALIVAAIEGRIAP